MAIRESGKSEKSESPFPSAVWMMPNEQFVNQDEYLAKFKDGMPIIN